MPRQDKGVTGRSTNSNIGSEIPPKAYQSLSREHLQQGDEVVSISEVLVQVSDVSLGLERKERNQFYQY